MPEQPQHSEKIRSLLQQKRAKPALDVFCNRDLDLSQIEWIGFDMDHTLAIYNRRPLDELVHRLTLEKLIADFDYPADIIDIPYNPDFGVRGLVLDKRLGNLLKLDSHKYVVSGLHGFSPISEKDKAVYRRKPPKLGSPRYVAVDTLFELPEVYLFAALVEHFGPSGHGGSFTALAEQLRDAVDGVHAEGVLKATVLSDLPKYIQLDSKLAPTLQALRDAGKKLFVMTNSYSEYTRGVMSYLLDDTAPTPGDWTSFFEIVITGAMKPSFFNSGAPFLRLNSKGQIVGEERQRLRQGVLYQHGNQRSFQDMIGTRGESILYVGDHIYGDILRSKEATAWRTLMIVPELEHEHEVMSQHGTLRDEAESLADEAWHERNALVETRELIEAIEAGEVQQASADDRSLMAELRDREAQQSIRYADLQRRARAKEAELQACFHPQWGSIFRARSQKTNFGGTVERYACLYSAKVSSLGLYSASHRYHSHASRMVHEE